MDLSEDLNRLFCDRVCVCDKFSNCIYAQVDIHNLSSTALIDYYVHANDVIRRSGHHNFQYCKFPVPTHWDLELFKQLLIESDYPDLGIIPMLKYGWPIEAKDCKFDREIPVNQKGARENSESVSEWVKAELKK